ncbi:WD40 repeat domain-containing protein [Pseudodesulfovibrio sp. F-1]|uniref:WD40 repeat domain-containing protein n=1 Tax=Pseudodesulfovibrio alkaliphilus TaxID=2661613 RepID=A0A7K1KK71_9BACT|nr:WD40 repeat domain-containing protein [Pseudodesulfovibrio alkaliphilus]MUM76391.1 WD40 repeat domain-containing protein [Pseudodesulfovibrio alkaliphilus]
MGRISSWDWEVGRKKVVDSLSPLQDHEWQEEPYVSPDGETLAAIVKVGDGEFSVRTNDEVWESTFEKLWFPRYAPDGRLTVLCQQDMEWSLAIDGEPWGDFAEYVWETKFSRNGSSIAAMTKIDNEYCVALNGTLWETCFENANQYSLSPDGRHTTAVVQVASLGQADIEGYKKGVYSVAVDGEAWDGRYVNLFTPTFSPDGERVAAQARLTSYDYTIAVDNKPWQKTFQQVWEPVFHPKGVGVVAPVRSAGKWGVALDGQFIWSPRYVQCLGLQYSASGEKLWGVVATGFGRFTVACDNVPWDATFPIVTDLVLSPDGHRAAVLASEYNRNFRIVVDGKAWPGVNDMAWPVVFSPDGSNAAALVEKGGRFHVLVNGKAYEQSFDRAFPPVFSEDGTKVLIRAIENNSYVRIVADMARF